MDSNLSCLRLTRHVAPRALACRVAAVVLAGGCSAETPSAVEARVRTDVAEVVSLLINGEPVSKATTLQAGTEFTAAIEVRGTGGNELTNVPLVTVSAYELSGEPVGEPAACRPLPNMGGKQGKKPQPVDPSTVFGSTDIGDDGVVRLTGTGKAGPEPGEYDLEVSFFDPQRPSVNEEDGTMEALTIASYRVTVLPAAAPAGE